MPDNPRIDLSWLPNTAQSEIDFPDSSFFKVPGGCQRLPTPAEVKVLAGMGLELPRPVGLCTHLQVRLRRRAFNLFILDPSLTRPPPIRFEELDLIVKFGSHVMVYEAKILLIIRRLFGDKIPVPEVYGWRVHDGLVFLYMQLIQGQPLIDQWDSLAISDKSLVCDQLRDIVTSLRSVEQEPDDIFIGSIDHGNLQDYVFQDRRKGGPFASIKMFHDWLSWLPGSFIPDCPKCEDPWRPLLPDDGPIKLTHGDLHPANIIISTTSPPRVLAVIDWAHTGWYPDYWEYSKACYTSSYDGEWRNQWIPKFLDVREEEHLVFAEYMMAIGAV